jgi:hypothetical protein
MNIQYIKNISLYTFYNFIASPTYPGLQNLPILLDTRAL